MPPKKIESKLEEEVDTAIGCNGVIRVIKWPGWSRLSMWSRWSNILVILYSFTQPKGI